jgi:hypothetical protein
MRRFLYAALAILTVLYVAYVTWLYAHHLFYPRTVLEVPIRFERGFSLTRHFSVGPAAKYWVGIKYNKVFQMTVTNPTPPAEFTAEFDILSGGSVVARGGTDSFRDWDRPWLITRDYVICFLAAFDADAGKSYDLSLRVTKALPSIIAAGPEAVVFVDPHFDMGYLLRKVCVISVGAAIVVIGFICGLSGKAEKENGEKRIGVASKRA